MLRGRQEALQVQGQPGLQNEFRTNKATQLDLIPQNKQTNKSPQSYIKYPKTLETQTTYIGNNKYLH